MLKLGHCDDSGVLGGLTLTAAKEIRDFRTFVTFLICCKWDTVKHADMYNTHGHTHTNV